MKPAEIVAELHELGPQDLAVILRTLSDRIPDACLRNGSALRDAGDFKDWLGEIAAILIQEGKLAA